MTLRGSHDAMPGEREAWEVGDLLIDVGRQRVTRGDAEIDLPKLSFDLLLALARRAPDVVSGDDLLTLVWPGLVVGPETITQRVKLLRQSLGDRTAEPRYVAALRGRGYRLVPDVRRATTAPSTATAAVLAGPASQVPVEAAVATQPPNAQPATEPPSTEKPRAQPRRTWHFWAIGMAGAALFAAFLLAVNVHDQRVERAATARVAGESTVAAAAERTVAVLPFENLSADPGDAYIAQGLPEMTLSRLASVQGLTVIARESAFQAAAHSGDLQEIGRKLGAGFLVGGSVQRNGDALRVTARLVDAGNATQLWAEDFDGSLGDLFRIQDTIGERVSAVLQSQMSGLVVKRTDAPRSPNVQAYLAYLRGRVLVGRFTVREAEAAAAAFEQAIALDPTFAAAHAALYDARMQAVGLRHGDLAAARLRNRPLLERALQLDPASGPALFARAMWEDLDVKEREAVFRRANELDSDNTRGLVAFSEFLDITDGSADGARVPGSGFDPSSRLARSGSGPLHSNDARTIEAGRLLEQALRIDPLSPRAHFRWAMRSFRGSGADVETPIVRILEMDPEYYPALQRMAKYRAILHGHPAEAVAIIERAIRNDPHNPWAPHTAVAFYLDLGDLASARAVAASTPVSFETTRTVLAQFVGDWRTAGTAAMQPRAFEFGFNESWGVAEALRDYALRSGDYARPMRLLRELYHLPEHVPFELTVASFRPSVQLAHLELLHGSSETGRDRLLAVIRWVDADRNLRPVYKRRTRAQALMLLGEPERALQDLAASFREDRDYNQWWYTIDRDPVWDNLRSDPRFMAIAADAREFAARELALVDGMRTRGEIPRRNEHKRTMQSHGTG
jgi:TolB-like protein/DNA-binding winged helix-turn-helix (wHTH) protein/tetratricopeptide (TPR) repeat protein